jgi:threonine/homoserine/homoserine lactone efflux protein
MENVGYHQCGTARQWIMDGKSADTFGARQGMMSFLAFIGVSIIVIVTPGPDTATTIRSTLVCGRRAGVCTAAGIAAGQTIWGLATSVGLAALLIASEPLFLAVKYVGAAYLIYLGILALCDAFWPAARDPAMTAVPHPQRRLGYWTAFRQGMISDLGNPKMAVFFTSLLPQFVPTSVATFSALLALGVVFAAMTFSWLTIYATAIDKLGDLLRRPALRRIIEGVTGTVLIGLGLRIAVERR